MNFNVITLFPEMFDALKVSIPGRAQKDQKLSVYPIQLRDFAVNDYGQVDDYPFGGEAGMVLKPEPLSDAIESIPGHDKQPIIYLTPQGKLFDQDTAKELAQHENITLICGHYKGIDERICDKYVTHEISIGDYVLSGGELPAMVLIDAVCRMLPDTLGDKRSAETDSFFENKLGWPVYTRPADYDGMKVPDVLLSGHHANIEKWRQEQSLKRTEERRPDLLG